MRSISSLRFPAILLAGIFGAGCSHQVAPEHLPGPAVAVSLGGASALPRGPEGDTVPPPARAGSAQPRPYNRVVTAEAQTQTGLYRTHRIGDRLLFEIPRSQWGRELLVLGRIAAGGGGGFAGGGIARVVSWEREGSRLLLRQRTHAVTADSAAAIFEAVEAQRLGTILVSFNVEAWGRDSAAVIDVTRLFTSGVAEFAGVSGVVSDRSFIERVTALPETINIEATQTGTQNPAPGAPSTARPNTTTVRMHWSLRSLPETPMRPRLHDRRVGINSVATIDYGRGRHGAERRRYIVRFRLEKQNPEAELSDVVQPIVFWIDRATPEWLVPWVRRGVEEWVPAFEHAGFRDALRASIAPSPAEDPSWSMFDARHNVILWRPSTIPNATGETVVDPRSGEILRAEVNIYHNILNLLRNWYFVQVSPLDPRAQRLPLPDSLMGRLVQFVVAHEIGHALGFPHNNKASAMYPADSIRSVSFLQRKGGHVATVMDYARFNYVAQPEDGIPPELLVPRVGPYDRFAVMWQNRPVSGTRTPDEERIALDQWARTQDTIPWLRFSTADATQDPMALDEAVGDADAVRSSELGLRNLERVAGALLRVAEIPGEDYLLLNELYGETLQQWGRYMGHVAAIVGGAESQERYGTGPRFTPLSRRTQREAVEFLTRHAFQVPPYFTEPEILRRIEQEGAVGRIANAQATVLGTLLAPGRFNRLIEYEALAGPRGDVYTVAELLRDLRQGIWAELSAAAPVVGVYRRNLQRAYLEQVERQVNPTQAGGAPGAMLALAEPMRPAARFTSDARPLMRGELLELSRQVGAALARTTDPMTRLHLRDVQFQIERILNPRS